VTATATHTIDLDTITEAATVLAEAFGLGQRGGPIEDWDVDDGDQVISAVVAGPDPFTVYLAVNVTIAGRLLADHDRLAEGLTKAAHVVLGPGATFTIEEIASTPGRPERFAGIFDHDQLCAIFGIASMEAAARSANGDDLGEASVATDVFEPQALRMTGGPSLVNAGALELLSDVEMEVTVELGRTRMPIRDLLSLQPGMVVEIDRAAGAPIDVLVNGRRIASGEVVVIDEEFGVRITEIVAVGER
jgi:flagellar motor switch protein FliN